MECATKDAQIDEEIKVSNGTRLKYLFPYFLLTPSPSKKILQRAVKQKRNENFNLSKVHWGDLKGGKCADNPFRIPT